jgi:hypothetical protein
MIVLQNERSHDSSVSIVTRLRAGLPGFNSGRGNGFFFFLSAPSCLDRLWGPRNQWVPWALPPGVKRPERNADHSFPSSTEVKNSRSYTSTPQYVFTAWCLVKHRGYFAFCTVEQDNLQKLMLLKQLRKARSRTYSFIPSRSHHIYISFISALSLRMGYTGI